jgi:WD40 repeat protein
MNPGEPAVTHHLAVFQAECAQLKFLSVGDKHMKFWTLNGRNLDSTKVSVSDGAIQAFLCSVAHDNRFFVGCDDGCIYEISVADKSDKQFTKFSKTAKKSFDHHNNQPPLDKNRKGCGITALFWYQSAAHNHDRIFSGSKNGSIVCWSVTEEGLKREFHISLDSLAEDVKISAKQIQSLSACHRGPDKVALLIATRGCEVIEVVCNYQGGGDLQMLATTKKQTMHEKGVLIRAHCNDELWGLATHPSIPEFASAGDDKTLRIFDAATHTMKHCEPLGNLSRAVEYSADGSLLALGFGGRVGKGKEAGGGLVRLYGIERDKDKVTKVTKLTEKQDAKQWISDVKFTPDCQSVIAGAHDCKIYVYDIKKDNAGYSLKLRTTFAKHNSVINHIDVSNDGRFMQSNCSAYELLFCDLGSGKQVTSATELRDVKWDTWTCTLGWPVQGIWATGMDGSDINAVARSHSGHLVATSDDFGKVNLFRYPCVKAGAQSVAYHGHSSHVMNVRWTVGDEFVLTCGGNDKCVMQWSHRMGDSSSGEQQTSDAAAPETAGAPDEFSGGGAGGGGGGEFEAPGGG